MQGRVTSSKTGRHAAPTSETLLHPLGHMHAACRQRPQTTVNAPTGHTMPTGHVPVAPLASTHLKFPWSNATMRCTKFSWASTLSEGSCARAVKYTTQPVPPKTQTKMFSSIPSGQVESVFALAIILAITEP